MATFSLLPNFVNYIRNPVKILTSYQNFNNYTKILVLLKFSKVFFGIKVSKPEEKKMVIKDTAESWAWVLWPRGEDKKLTLTHRTLLRSASLFYTPIAVHLTIYMMDDGDRQWTATDGRTHALMRWNYEGMNPNVETTFVMVSWKIPI